MSDNRYIPKGFSITVSWVVSVHSGWVTMDIYPEVVTEMHILLLWMAMYLLPAG